MKQNKLFKLWLLAVVMLAGSMGVKGQYAGSGTFNKITSLDDLTDGYYVVVNSGDAYAMNNINTGSYFAHIAITPSAGTIINPAAAIVWKIETNGGGRSIYNEASSKYVSYTGTANAAQVVDAVVADNQRWTFTYASDLFSVANVAIPTRILQYNSGSPRFACYTSSQQKLLLYKLQPTSGTAAPSFTPPAGIYTSVQSVTLSSTTSGAKIYYTTDGSEPSSGSTLYTGAINVAATTTIKAIAYDASNANPSAVVEAVYTIDIFPSITVTPATTSAITNVEIGKTASRTLTVNGVNLTEDLSVSLTGDVDQFSLSTTTLAQTDGKVTDGKVTITYAPTAVGSHSVVVTISSQGITPFTRTISGNSINPPLVAPTATDATGISQTGFTANWNAVDGAESYILDVYTKNTGSLTNDLFISEYGEGSSNNKYIELYNGTGTSVDLSAYTLKQAINGGGWDVDISYTLPLTGTIAHGDVFVIANDGASATVKDAADLLITYSTTNQGGRVVSFTGNDAMGLFKDNVLIDVFGDPTSSSTISVAGFTTYGQDRTHIRKSSINKGNIDWASSSGTDVESSEWISYPQDTWTFVGSHILDGAKTPITGSPFTTTSTSQAVSGLANTGIYFYTVTAVRGTEESPLSNEIGPISLTATGLSNAKVDALAWTSSGKVMLNASAGEVIEIFNVAGQKVVSRPAVDGLNSVDVSAKGVVIVKVNNRISKVIL